MCYVEEHVPSCSKCLDVDEDCGVSSCAAVPFVQRVFAFLVFCVTINSTWAKVSCFSAHGAAISGSEYRRVRNTDNATCAMECRDDSSCLAYEYYFETSTCFLKSSDQVASFQSRSLSGDLRLKKNVSTGFCIDDEDVTRDRFMEHTATGVVIADFDDLQGEMCSNLCRLVPGVTVFSWTPSDLDDDEPELGKCSCIKSLSGLHLSYNSFAGFLGPIRPRRHILQRL